MQRSRLRDLGPTIGDLPPGPHNAITDVAGVLVGHELSQDAPFDFALPLVAETFDGWLSDPSALAVRPSHVHAALRAAASGPLAEGSVGGGTGMNTHELKAGIGTASRRIEVAGETWTVGLLAQTSYGRRDRLRLDGHVRLHIPARPADRAAQGCGYHVDQNPDSDSVFLGSLVSGFWPLHRQPAGVDCTGRLRQGRPRRSYSRRAFIAILASS